jgi:hypothetical protein
MRRNLPLILLLLLSSAASAFPAAAYRSEQPAAAV